MSVEPQANPGPADLDDDARHLAQLGYTQWFRGGRRTFMVAATEGATSPEVEKVLDD